MLVAVVCVGSDWHLKPSGQATALVNSPFHSTPSRSADVIVFIKWDASLDPENVSLKVSPVYTEILI